jgi:thiamine pyrophosphate-dependent acetolactate synthase large subunit-like protein
MSATVADALARALAAAGFSPCFGYLGHHIEPLPQALLQAGCQVVIAASETGAGYMAQGLALASSRPALCFCGGSPGLAMLIPALQAARLESIPLLVILGQSGRDGLPTFQDTGSAGSRDRELLAALQITNLHLESAGDLSAILRSAWGWLQQPEPVVLTVPCDVMAAPWTDRDPPAIREPVWDPRNRVADRDCSPRPGCTEPYPVPSDPDTNGYRAVVTELLKHLPAETLWFGDAGQPRHAMAIELQRRGLPLFQSASSGPMGWALAAAIGAASHQPARPVCCFTGDGSALMLANEWSTAVKLQRPITFVLAENGALGQPFARLQNTGAETLAKLPVMDWCALARSMGLPAQRVAKVQQLAVGLAALPAAGPRLLVVPLPARDPAVQPPYTLIRTT